MTRKHKRKWEDNIKLKPEHVKTPTPRSRVLLKKVIDKESDKDSFYSAYGIAAGNEVFIRIGEFAKCMSNVFQKHFSMKLQLTLDCLG
jgi:hypothetical protein